jgi:MFS family permease
MGVSEGLAEKDMWIATVAIGALYVGSTILTPLYPIYRQVFGISPLTITVVYAVYVVGNLTVLFLFGRLSDQVGRRLTTLVALALTLLSALTFLFAAGTPELLLGRAINGFAAGLGAGALTAWIAELEPGKDRARAAVVASAGNLAGLAVGGVMSGLLAEYVAAPLRTVFGLYILILLVVGILLLRVKETVGRKVHTVTDLDLRPRVGVPKEIRFSFVAPACIAFAAFALGGFVSALIPGIITQGLHVSHVAVVGAVVTVFFLVACLAAGLSRKLASWTAMFSGAACVFPAVALLVCAEMFRSMPLLIVTAGVGGAAMALSYRGSLQVLNEIAPQDKRAEVVSAYLLMCYLGNSLPVLGVGLLTTLLEPPRAHEIFAAVVATLALAAILTGVASRKKQRRQQARLPSSATASSEKPASVQAKLPSGSTSSDVLRASGRRTWP